MRAIHSFKTYKGVPYKVIFTKNLKDEEGYECFGLCDPPEEKTPLIQLNPDQTNSQLCETFAHELAHAFFWEKSETEINKFAKTLMTGLKKLGFKIN